MPDIQIPAETVEQFAMFMQRRDAIEQGGIIDGIARPTWDELGEGGQEAYMRDAIAYVGALAQLGMRPADTFAQEALGWIDYCLDLPMYANAISDYGKGITDAFRAVRKILLQGIGDDARAMVAAREARQ